MQPYNVSLHRNKWLLDAIWYYFGQRWSMMELQKKFIQRVLIKLRRLAIRKKSLRRMKKWLRRAQRRRHSDRGLGSNTTTWHGKGGTEHACETHKVAALTVHLWKWFHDMDWSATDVAVFSIAWLLEHQHGSVQTPDDRLSMFKYMLLPATMRMPEGQRRDAIIARQSQILFYDMRIDERQDLIDTMMPDAYRVNVRDVATRVLQTVQTSYQAYQDALQWDTSTSRQAQAKEQTMGQLLLFDIQRRSGKTMLTKTGLNPAQSLERSGREVAAMLEHQQQFANQRVGYHAPVAAITGTQLPANRASPVRSQAIRKQSVQSPIHHEAMLNKLDARKNMQVSNMEVKTSAVHASRLLMQLKHPVLANKSSSAHWDATQKSDADTNGSQTAKRRGTWMKQALYDRLKRQPLRVRHSVQQRVRNATTTYRTVSSASLVQRAVAWNRHSNSAVVAREKEGRTPTKSVWAASHSMFFHAKPYAQGAPQTPFKRARLCMDATTSKHSLSHNAFTSRGRFVSLFDGCQEKSVFAYRQKGG